MEPELETAEVGSLGAVDVHAQVVQARHQDASITHRLFRGASIYVVGLALGKGLTVILQIILGRWLGPAQYGLYALGYGVVSLASWVSVLGLDQGVLRYCAVYRTQGQFGRVRTTFLRAAAFAAVASVATTAVFVLGAPRIAGWFFIPSFARVLADFAWSLPFLAIIRIAGTYFQSIHDIYRMCVLQILARPIFNLVLLGVAVAMGWGIRGAVGAFVLCCVGTAALGGFYLTKRLPEKQFAPDAVEVKHLPLLRYSLTLMLVGLSYQVILRVPQVLLGHLGTSTDVGVYSAGGSFALAFGFMTLTFLQPAIPMMVDLYETGQTEGLRKLYQSTTRWTLAVVMPAFLFLSLFSSEVMRLFGKGFDVAGPVLLLLSLAWLVFYGKGPGGALLEMTGRQNLDLANSTGVGVLIVLLNCWAIPHHGAYGAAIATAFGIGVWAFVEYLEVRLLYDISPWSSGALLNILAAAITAAVTVLLRPLVPWEVVLLIATSLYVALYLGFCLEADDRRLLAAARNRFQDWVRS